MRQLVNRFGPRTSFLILGLLLTAIPTLALEQEGPTVAATVDRGDGGERSANWGTAHRTSYVVPAWEFQTRNGSTLGYLDYSRYSTTATEALAPLHLPSGAQINRIEVQGCDESATEQIRFIIYRVNVAGLTEIFSSTGVTGVEATPGCAYFGLDVDPHTVDNWNWAYYMTVRNTDLTAATSDTRYSAARVSYTLQVSAAPATATFPNDVPTTHAFFRFIEALAKAGITGGCGTNAYCPDSPVTRGQMAVFLSTALGLHYSN